LRKDSRVTVSRTATASATSPATWPVSPGWTKAMAEEPGTGVGWPLGAGPPGEGLGVADGLIALAVAVLLTVTRLSLRKRFRSRKQGS